jgi:hypothetical protein
MPLTKDYNTERSKYLKQYEENLKKSKEEFKQRWVDKYNNTFKYTEKTPLIDQKNENNQQLIDEKLQTDIFNNEHYVNVLKGYLNNLSKSETVNDYIIEHLDEDKIQYLAINWNIILQQLKKDIKPPISKEDFLVKLLNIIKNQNKITDVVENNTETLDKVSGANDKLLNLYNNQENDDLYNVYGLNDINDESNPTMIHNKLIKLTINDLKSLAISTNINIPYNVRRKKENIINYISNSVNAFENEYEFDNFINALNTYDMPKNKMARV